MTQSVMDRLLTAGLCGNTLGQDIQTLTYHSSISNMAFHLKDVCSSNFRGRSHIAPKNVWKTLGALLSPFFQSARAVALRRRLSLQPSAALSVTRRKFRHMTCGALAAF